MKQAHGSYQFSTFSIIYGLENAEVEQWVIFFDKFRYRLKEAACSMSERRYFMIHSILC